MEVDDREWLIALLILVGSGLVGAWIAHVARPVETTSGDVQRYSPWPGGILGFLLGPIGWLALGMFTAERMPDGTPKVKVVK